MEGSGICEAEAMIRSFDGGLGWGGLQRAELQPNARTVSNLKRSRARIRSFDGGLGWGGLQRAGIQPSGGKVSNLKSSRGESLRRSIAVNHLTAA